MKFWNYFGEFFTDNFELHAYFKTKREFLIECLIESFKVISFKLYDFKSLYDTD